MSWQILEGDCRDVLATLPAGSVQTCVTSPPYFGLRDYGTGEWEGGDPECDHGGERVARRQAGRQTDVDGGIPGSLRDKPVTVCKCGARRVDRQIGLEPTPDEFVQALVGVFREVRRVLRDDGTVWLNLGDSYAANMGGAIGATSQRHGRSNIGRQMSAGVPDGLKPKDLIGIPWAVAQALRAPDYHGRIRVERDRVWLAATLDAEGSICGFTHQRADDGSARTGVHVTLTNTNEPLLAEADRIWPASRVEHENHGEGHFGGRPSWRWVAHGAENKALLMRELFPYMIVKKDQACLAYTFFTLSMDAKRLGHSPQRDEVREKRAWLVDALSRLNRGEDFDVPSWVQEPPTVETTGWYLRSDIIWHKPNPMPESVTDRPTKAHEYLFLLSKGPRYFYDADAVREPHEGAMTEWRLKNGMEKPGPKWKAMEDDGTHGVGGFSGGMNPAGRNKRSVWTVAHSDMVRLRSDLSEADRAYVLGELHARGLLGGT
jgi:DNA modification methylase